MTEHYHQRNCNGTSADEQFGPRCDCLKRIDAFRPLEVYWRPKGADGKAFIDAMSKAARLDDLKEENRRLMELCDAHKSQIEQMRLTIQRLETDNAALTGQLTSPSWATKVQWSEEVGRDNERLRELLRLALVWVDRDSMLRGEIDAELERGE